MADKSSREKLTHAFAPLSLGLLLFTSAIAAGLATGVADAQQAELNSASKFEDGFYEKVQTLINSGETRDYSVIVFVQDIDPKSEKEVGSANKDKLENEIKNTLNAKQIYKAQVLDFIVANVSLTKLDKIASYDFVKLIADGEVKGELTGISSEIAIEPAGGSTSKFGSIKETPLTSIIQPDINNGAVVVNSRSTGYTGNGIKIAVIDTGINTGHRDLDNSPSTKVVYQKDFTGTGFGDTCGHGTAIAGIAAGTGEVNAAYKGIAPDAQLMNIKVANGCSAPSASNAISGIDDAVANGAKVISLSWDFGLSYTSIGVAADQAVEKGVVVVAAVGNDPIASSTGTIDPNTVRSPGNAFNVITAGGINDQDSTSASNVVVARWYDSSRASWMGTARGLTEDGRMKPDVVAPAVNVAAPDLQTGTNSNYWPNNSGTSFAAPFVAGAAAQILQAHPDWTPAQVKVAIKYTAKKSTFPNLSSEPEDTVGKGVLNVGAAVALTTTTVNSNMGLAYGMDLATYTVKDDFGVTTNQVEFKLQKETSLANGLSAINGKVRQTSSSSWQTMFNKLYPTSIKIGTTSVTLTDAKLVAGPRVDPTGADDTNVFVTYLSNGVKIKLNYFMNPTSMYYSVIFDGSCSSTCTVVTYSDINLKPASSTDNNDKARPTATGSPYSTEQKLTTTVFYIRDSTTSLPYLRHNAATTQTEWILKTHPMTATPDSYYNSETLNTSTGDDLVFDYQGSVTGAGTGITLGPTFNILWS